MRRSAIEWPLKKSFPAHLLPCGVIKDLKKGELIPYPCDPKGFYLVVDGLVHVFCVPGNGKRKVISVVESGDMFYEVTFWLDLLPFTEAEAIKDTRALFFSQDTAIRLANEDAAFQAQLLYNLANQAIWTGVDLMGVCLEDPGVLLLDVLRIQASKEGRKTADGMEIRVNQHELADRLGLNRVTIYRWLKRFTERGILRVERGRIILLGQHA